MSRRSTRVLTKKPISGSISIRPRLATGVPMTRSSCLDSRASSTAHRPAIGNDVVHGNEQDMLLFAQLYEPPADKRTACEKERCHGLLRHQPFEFLLGLGMRPQIVFVQVKTTVLRSDALQQLAINI